MIRIYLVGQQLVCFDKGETAFKQKYGNRYEQVGTVKELSNLQAAISKLSRQYNIPDVVQDVHIKRRVGWCYKTDEQKAATREKMSEVKLGRPRRQWIKDRISAGMQGKANHKGKKHSEFAKKAIAFSRRGKNPVQGLRWCHNPITGKELRAKELPEGFIWGRDKSVLYQFN